MNNSNQTHRFDPSMCTSPQLMTTYQKACNGSETCANNLQTFCKTQIQTNKEFNLQNDLLTCTIQCGKDDSCKKECVTKLSQ